MVDIGISSSYKLNSSGIPVILVEFQKYLLNIPLVYQWKFRGQKYFNIAHVLQDKRLTIFTRPAKSCTCPLKAYAIEKIRE